MKLSLTTDDGELLAQWTVEEDFGDMSKPIARQYMCNEIATEIDAMQRFLAEKEQNNKLFHALAKERQANQDTQK